MNRQETPIYSSYVGLSLRPAEGEISLLVYGSSCNRTRRYSCVLDKWSSLPLDEEEADAALYLRLSMEDSSVVQIQMVLDFDAATRLWDSTQELVGAVDLTAKTLTCPPPLPKVQSKLF